MIYEMLFGTRPFERHCPTSYVRYLEHLLATASTHSNSFSSSLDNSLEAVTVSDSRPKGTKPWKLPTCFDEEMKLEDNLPIEVKIRIPLIDTLMRAVSQSLRRLLKQLFDPRPWMRITWPSTEAFMRQEWFMLHNITVGDVKAQNLSTLFASSERVTDRNFESMSKASVPPIREQSVVDICISAKLENNQKKGSIYEHGESRDPFRDFYYIDDEFKDFFIA